MSNINFSDTPPAAPGGTVNVTWQFDAGGDISANVPAAVAALWNSWTPTVTISPGGFTYNGLHAAEFLQVGSIVFFHIAVNVTLTGLANPANTVSATLPVPWIAGAWPVQLTGAAWTSSAPTNAQWINTSIGPSGIAFGVGTLLTSGTPYELSASGFYRVI